MGMCLKYFFIFSKNKHGEDQPETNKNGCLQGMGKHGLKVLRLGVRLL